MIESPVKILLIEDDEIDRTLVRRLLGSAYLLNEAATGRMGRELLTDQDDPPDLVLLDYRLPDLDSFELLREAVALEIPVIVLTGVERTDIIVEAMQEGAQDYLLKDELTKNGLQRAISNGMEQAELKRNVALQQRQIAKQAKALEEQNRQIRTLASAVTLAEQRERKRVAQILHDHVQQLLYGVQMRLQLLASDLPNDASAPVYEHLVESTRLITDAVDATRSLAVDLSPPMLKDEGIDVALQWLVSQMERIHNLHVELHVEDAFEYNVKSEDLYVLIFQLVRELLFNVIKHANVLEVDLYLYEENDRKRITVEDKGVGFEFDHMVRAKWKPEQGYGLYSVRERIALFGGQLLVDSHPGNGARVTIVLPDEV